MCNLTALPPNRPAAKRHQCGTLAAHRRSRTAPPTPPQRTKVSQLRYLCAPNCGIFSGAGTACRDFVLCSPGKLHQPGPLPRKTKKYALLGLCTNFLSLSSVYHCLFRRRARPGHHFLSQLHLENAGEWSNPNLKVKS